MWAVCISLLCKRISAAGFDQKADCLSGSVGGDVKVWASQRWDITDLISAKPTAAVLVRFLLSEVRLLISSENLRLRPLASSNIYFLILNFSWVKVSSTSSHCQRLEEVVTVELFCSALLPLPLLSWNCCKFCCGSSFCTLLSAVEIITFLYRETLMVHDEF